MVWWLEMGDFSSQGHLEHLAYVVWMAIFSLKIRPLHFPISKIFACGAQKLDLAYVYAVSVAVVGGYVWMQRAVCCCAEHQHVHVVTG